MARRGARAWRPAGGRGPVAVLDHDVTSTSFSRRQAISIDGLPVIAGLHRAGMLDWPGRVAATVFLGGCNLRCPFCHNPELIGSPRRPQSADALFELVRERRAWLDGVVVTGGEASIHPELPSLLRALKREGMPVKLDTNGTRPDVLESLFDEGLVDFVALDVKATPDRYVRATGVADMWPAVDRSIALVLDSGVDHEFRTTCYPLAVGPDDPVRIAARLDGGRRYVLQQFRPQRTYDPAALSVRPHSSETLCRAAERCSSFLPTVVRGT